MALKKLRFEDILLGLTLSLTFLYPLIITSIIIYQDSKKGEWERKIFGKVENVFLSKNCKKRILEVVPYFYYVNEGFIKKLKELCDLTTGEKPQRYVYKRLEGESLYLIKLKKGALKILGKWISEGEFKIILITYEKGD